VPEFEDDELEPQTEFEVVPQELDDAEMWDVNNPNEDELKLSKIKGIIFVNPRPCSRLIDILIRARLTHGRGSISRSGPCQQKKNKDRTYQRRLYALLSQFERRPPVVVS
jgi:hypothetical protein